MLGNATSCLFLRDTATTSSLNPRFSAASYESPGPQHRRAPWGSSPTTTGRVGSGKWRTPNTKRPMGHRSNRPNRRDVPQGARAATRSSSPKAGPTWEKGGCGREGRTRRRRGSTRGIGHEHGTGARREKKHSSMTQHTLTIHTHRHSTTRQPLCSTGDTCDDRDSSRFARSSPQDRLRSNPGGEKPSFSWKGTRTSLAAKRVLAPAVPG